MLWIFFDIFTHNPFSFPMKNSTHLAPIMTAFHQVEDPIVRSALDYIFWQPKMCHKTVLSLGFLFILPPFAPAMCVRPWAWPKAKEGAATSVWCLFSISLHWGGKTSDRRTQKYVVNLLQLKFFFLLFFFWEGGGKVSELPHLNEA